MAPRDRFLRWSRTPVLHFLVLGGALFLLRSAWAPTAPTGAALPAAPPASGGRSARPAVASLPGDPGAGRLVVVPAARIARLRQAAAGRRRPLSPAEEARLIEGMIDEELLFREAVAAGLDRSGPVRRRLIQNMQFLKLSEGGHPGTLYRQAVDLGFDRTDPVVRRFLVEQMRVLARAGTKPDVFAPAELQGYLDRHADRFRIPAFVRLSHVFLSTDARGPRLAEEAARLLRRLRSDHVSPEAAVALGDPFLLGHHPGLLSQNGLERLFGADLAAAAMRLPVGVWSGPVRSPYGLHLVFVHESVPGEPARLADVRRQVVLGLAGERQEERLATYLRGLRQRYEIRIEAPEAAGAGLRPEVSR